MSKTHGRIKHHRVRAYHAQDGLCFYCQTALWEPSIESSKAAMKRLGFSGPTATADLARHRSTAEHLIRKSDGGPGVADNIRASCFPCNLTREMSSVADHLAARSPAGVR